jgi:hypothetical protein
MSDVNVFPLGQNRTTYFIVGGTVLLLVGFLSYKAWQYEKNQKELLATQLAELNQKFEKFAPGFAQAGNQPQLDQNKLKADLSAEFQKQLDQQKAEILAKVNGIIQFKLQDIHGKLDELTPGVYSYPKKANEKVIDYLTVDATQKPVDFKIGFLPQQINLTGTLNFSAKDGTTTFWMQAQKTKTSGGLEVDIPQLNFTPSSEFTNWVAQLRGKDTHISVMPKYTVDLLMGKQYSNGVVATKNVFGVQGQYNWVGGFNAGAGFIGDSVFIKAGWSFGKR